MTTFAAAGPGSRGRGLGSPLGGRFLLRTRGRGSAAACSTSPLRCVPYLALSVLMYLSLQVSYLLVLALAVPTAGFLVRVFVMFHDCAHGSLLPSKRANAWLGAILGLLVFAPFLCWKHDHAVHHATSGDLDRRGTGDVRTLTVSEYRALSRRGRMGYRVFRNPLVMFGLGPIAAMVIGPRSSRAGHAHACGAVCSAPTWRSSCCLVRSAGRSAGENSCWLRRRPLCSPGRWASGCSMSSTNSRMPTGRAPTIGATQKPRCAEARTCACQGRFSSSRATSASTTCITSMHASPTTTCSARTTRTRSSTRCPRFPLWDGLRAVRLKLWDEQHGRLVTFAQARRAPAAAAQPTP